MFKIRNIAAVAAPLALAFGFTTATPAAAQEKYLGEIFMGGWNFCPRASAKTDGQLLAISGNSALFSLLGTQFGGDGRTTFALPDLRGRVPMHNGTGPGLTARTIGQRFGLEDVTLTTAQMPSHNHLMGASNLPGDKQRPGNDYLAYPNVNENLPATDKIKLYADELLDDPARYLEADAITNTGGNLSHPNVQPSLVIQFCIVTQGLYPSRS